MDSCQGDICHITVWEYLLHLVINTVTVIALRWWLMLGFCHDFQF